MTNIQARSQGQRQITVPYKGFFMFRLDSVYLIQNYKKMLKTNEEKQKSMKKLGVI